MGKKRKTAKTGDKALYSSRNIISDSSKSKKNDNDDNMYTEVDQYHNKKEEEFLKLDADEGGEESEDDGISRQENILDLGGDNTSSEEDESSDEDENDKDSVNEKDEPAVSDDSSDDDMDMENEDVLDWGNKKSMYYHGDTADLEIGQDVDDAFLEEEAAKEVLAARYQQMDEDDFMLDGQQEQQKQAKETDDQDIETLTASRHLSKMSKSAKRKLLQAHHPELLPLLSHFSQVVQDLNFRTGVVHKALTHSKDASPETVGATAEGMEYLRTKTLLQATTALNVAAYLLLKSEEAAVDGEGSNIATHPVITQLKKLSALSEKLEDQVEVNLPSMPEQIDNLVKAAALMKGDTVNNTNDSEEEDSDTDDDEQDSDNEKTDQQITPAHTRKISTVSDSSEENDHLVDEEIARTTLNEARFGLRVQEVGGDRQQKKQRRRRAAPSDAGDQEEDENTTSKGAKSLASTINAIEQRSASKRKSKTSQVEELDSQIGENEDLQRGLAMMEAELGPLDDDGEDEKGNDVVDNELDDDGLDDGDGNDFYSQVSKQSKSRKALKKSLYQVAPKYPGMEAEIQGERAVSKTILKNRGLVAHKAKINRNPRVKKREQYRKAVIRRKGAVREVRTDEGHKYGGEETGIKAKLSRSRKLGVS